MVQLNPLTGSQNAENLISEDLNFKTFPVKYVKVIKLSQTKYYT